MKLSEFFNKFRSWTLWGNLAAMAAVVVLLGLGVRYGLDLYTHHGESIPIPKLTHKSYEEAEQILDHFDLKLVVADTGYIKTLPPGCILEQSPAAGERVKAGRVVYVTINALESPTIKLPDVIDNSSLREAMAKLTSMGFKLDQPQFVAGEKDWVYGILVNGRNVVYGDRIPVDAKLVIQVGNGMRDASDSVNYVDPVYHEEDEFMEMGETDDFEEVPEAPAESSAPDRPSAPEPSTVPKQDIPAEH